MGRRRYLESAEMYAQTQNSFEEVALKFIRLDDKLYDALRKFLHKKLESLRVQVSDIPLGLCYGLAHI